MRLPSRRLLTVAARCCGVQEFNKRWNEQMQEYEKECAEQEQALRVRAAACLELAWLTRACSL